MGMKYSASFEEVAVTAVQDLFELVAPADSIITVHSVRIGQSSDAADAEAEMLPIAIVRGEGTVTSGAGGSTPTKAPLESGFAASGATVEANNTTKMVVGTGTLTILLNDTFNVAVGWLYQPTPEERIIISPSDRITIELVTAPGDSLDMNGTIVWEEIGG